MLAWYFTGFPFFFFLVIVSALNLIYTIHFGFKGQGEKIHHYTLLDGEMIIDTMPDSQKQERRYLIYDMMTINHVPVIEVWFIYLLTMKVLLMEKTLCVCVCFVWKGRKPHVLYAVFNQKNVAKFNWHAWWRVLFFCYLYCIAQLTRLMWLQM